MVLSRANPQVLRFGVKGLRVWELGFRLGLCGPRPQPLPRTTFTHHTCNAHNCAQTSKRIFDVQCLGFGVCWTSTRDLDRSERTHQTSVRKFQGRVKPLPHNYWSNKLWKSYLWLKGGGEAINPKSTVGGPPWLGIRA